MKRRIHAEGPARWLVEMAEWLMPDVAAGRVQELKEKHTSPSRFFSETVSYIRGTVWVWTRRAFNFERMLAEAFLLSIPFWGTPLMPAIAVVAAAVGILRLREAFIFPGTGSVGEMLADALIGAAAIVVTQVFFWWAAPSLAMSATLLFWGTACGMPGVAVLRAYFHFHTTSYNGDVARAISVLKAAWRVTALWIAACFALLHLNIEAVPARWDGRDFVLIVGATIAISIMYLLQSKEIGTIGGKDKLLTVRPGIVEEELAAKRDTLLQTASLFFEVLFFTLLAFPLGSAVWRWFNGDARDINWTKVGSNSAELVMLVCLLWMIKQINAAAAQEMDKHIAAHKADPEWQK
jgi:hypothetical protein